MKNIIRFPMVNADDKAYPEETFDWLISRIGEYLDFLKRVSPKKDKSEWSKKFIAVLKFLGDYKIEDDLQRKIEKNRNLRILRVGEIGSD